MMASYGEQGIGYHLMISVADMVFPVVLGLFLLTGTAYVVGQLFGAQVVRWAVVLPLVYMLADYAENIGIWTMLLRYPAEVMWAAVLSNGAMIVKNAAANTTIALMVVGLIIVMLREVYGQMRGARA